MKLSEMRSNLYQFIRRDLFHNREWLQMIKYASIRSHFEKFITKIISGRLTIFILVTIKDLQYKC